MKCAAGILAIQLSTLVLLLSDWQMAIQAWRTARLKTQQLF